MTRLSPSALPGNNYYAKGLMSVQEINVTKLKELLKDREQVEIIDVREREEYNIVRFRDSKLIPMGLPIHFMIYALILSDYTINQIKKGSHCLLI